MDQYCYHGFLANPILVLGSTKRLVRKGMARLILISDARKLLSYKEGL